MSFTFNPLTGKFDIVGSQDAATEVVTYARFPKKITVFTGSRFSIEEAGAAQIFSADLAQGFTVFNSVLVKSGGSLSIENNSKGTVLG